MGRPDAPPQLRALGDTLLEVNARHERLIDGLLVLARSEQSLAVREPVDLAALAARTAEQFAAEAASVGVAVEVSADGPAPVAGDPVLLERLVQNLVENGVRHNVAGGWVRAGVEAGGLTVTNTGPVVPGHEVAGLFEPFRRLRDRVGPGTGLGLSIVRSVARAHGGDVTASPRAGGGLVVRVTLPATVERHTRSPAAVLTS
jgi:signal transduction histidine kinase